MISRKGCSARKQFEIDVKQVSMVNGNGVWGEMGFFLLLFAQLINQPTNVVFRPAD